MRVGVATRKALVVFAAALFASLTTALAPAQQASTSNSVQIQDFALTSQKSGWLIAGNHLYWTDSLGASWSDITPASASSISAVTFRADGSGWALTSGSGSLAMARTTDSGQHWSTAPIAPPFTEAKSFNGNASISFADAKNGFLMLGLQSSSAFRPGLLMHTTDGGITWQTLAAPPIGGNIVFTDAKHGFNGPGAAGDELYTTSDAGNSWQRVTLPTPGKFSSANSTISLPTFSNATNGNLLRSFVTELTPTVVKYVTADGGATWSVDSTLPDTQNAIAADGTLAHIVAPNAKLSAISSRFSSASNGLVLFHSSTCTDGTCTTIDSLRSTADGGRTFAAVAPAGGVSFDRNTTMRVPTTLPSSIAATGGFTPDSSTVYSNSGALGFDACTLPTLAQMQDWYTNSTNRVAGIYIGGNSYANCSQSLSKLNATYVSSLLAQGWQIEPLWVGTQAPNSSCSGCAQMTTSTTADNALGITEADSAIAALNALGIGQGSPIVYDMEAYTRNATNEAATVAFLEGFNTEMHAKGYIAAVYSSHPEFTDWYPTALTPAIDIIWFAYFQQSSGPCVTDCMDVFPPIDIDSGAGSTYWTNQHRARQESPGHNETFGTTTLNIDQDWVVASMVTATPNALTVTKSPSAGGTVTSGTITNPNSDSTILTSINCGSSCTANFAPTDTITLVATASTGYTFNAWTGCTSTSGTTCTVAMTAAATVTAAFIPTNSITVNKTGNGTGTVTAADNSINCGTTCTATYSSGTTVVLTASASVGSTFASWTGCTTAVGTTCNVTVGGAIAVTATFTAPVTLTVAASPTAGGTITSSDAKLNCGATCSASYAYNSTATLTATPSAGYVFASWSGCTSTTATCTTAALVGSTTVTANFTGPVTLTVAASPSGGGTVTSADSKINCGATCSASYTYNTTSTLTATPATGYVFTGWTGCTSTTATCTTAALVTATTVTANFAQPSYTAVGPTSGITIARGSAGSATLTFTLMNGWTGTFTNFACPNAPTGITCTGAGVTNVMTACNTVSPNTTCLIPVTIAVGSTFSQSIVPANLPHSDHTSPITFAMLALPALLLPFSLRKRRHLRSLNITLAFIAMLGLTQLVTGCGGSSTPAGPTQTTKTVSVPITYTATQTGGTATSGTPINVSVTVTY